VSAERTLAALTGAIAAHGGPRYRAIAIDPELDREGGQPGGNIRVALLFDPARVGFEPRGSAGPLTAVEVIGMEDTLRFEPNPARVAPASPAFTLPSGEGVRRSLAVEFAVAGKPLFVIANHWSSKWDDDRAFGAVQPPARPTGEKRLAQARVVRELVERLIAAHPQARVVVLGDLNDLPWSEPVERLAAPPMVNLLARVPSNSRYTYNFEGASQAIDYVVVSRSLAANAQVEIVHLNSNCPDALRVSDHDPVVASLRVGARNGRREKPEPEDQ
jgi:predicted extracellular nuclease